jgi:hypothetical protein
MTMKKYQKSSSSVGQNEVKQRDSKQDMIEFTWNSDRKKRKIHRSDFQREQETKEHQHEASNPPMVPHGGPKKPHIAPFVEYPNSSPSL